MFTQVVPFDAADPYVDAADEDVADPFVSQAYVYLSLVAKIVPLLPKANIPRVEFPAADPYPAFALADVA